MNASGTLYIVATPIGHLDDLSRRAIETLNSVDIILAEDTRHSAKLLKAIGCSTPLQAYHAHNETKALKPILNGLLEGKNYALISDAGTPLICDPGFELVRLAKQNNVFVTPIPGACAFVAALSAAGVPCDRFAFMGFLPAKALARRKALKDNSQLGLTVVCYESTHRIMACLEDIIEVFGQTYSFVIAKELTKSYEQFLYANAQTIKAWLLDDPAHQKGEFILIFPALEELQAHTSEDQHLLTILLGELPLKQAVKIASQLSSTHKNALYQLALDLKARP